MDRALPTIGAHEWDRRYSGPVAVWGHRPNCWVEEELNGLPPGRALDLGAGEGRHAVWLAGRGWEVEAVDFSAAGLQAGCRQAEAEGVADRITWTVADATAYNPAPDSLDLALMAYLQLPEDELETAIAAAVAALAAKGRFLLVSHDLANLNAGTGGPQDPVVLQSPQQVSSWLEKAGLEVLSAETRSRPVAGSVRPALDCVVRAIRS